MGLELELKEAWKRFSDEFQKAKADRIPDLRKLIATSKDELVRLQKQLDELPACIEKWEAELRNLERPMQTPPLSEFLALALGRGQIVPSEVSQPVVEKDTPHVFQKTPRLELPGGGDT